MSKETHEGPGAWLKNYLAEREVKEAAKPKRMSRHPYAQEEPEPTMSLDSSLDLLYSMDPDEWDENEESDPTAHGPEFDFHD